jgi:hypothetical protein
MPLSLEDRLFIKQGDKTDQENFVLGRAMKVWIAPLPLGQSVPNVTLVEQASAVLADATSLSLTATEEIVLYRNQPLRFGAVVVLVKATTTVTTTATTVPIYPADGGISAAATAEVYPMTPLFSAKEGGIPDSSASFAEAHNKNMGYYSVSEKIKEDYSATIAGEINFTDPALNIINDIHINGLSKLFVQVRHSVLTEIGTQKYGEGPFAVQYHGVPTAKVSDPEGGFVAISLEMKISGKLDPYVIL